MEQSLLEKTKVRINGQEHLIRPSHTVSSYLEELGIPPDGILVSRNEVLVRKKFWSETPLQTGDSIEILTAFEGG